MSARQLLFLVVAATAALGALLLIRGMGARQAQQAKAEAPVAGEQVLVLAADVAQGAPLKPSDLAWRVFPHESVSAHFVRQASQPNGLTDFTGAVTRRPFQAGE